MKTKTGWVIFAVVALTAMSGTELPFEQAQQRAVALRAEIARHDELYFKQAAPETTDAQYDGLKRELQALARRFPELDTGATMGDDHSDGFATYRHRVPMLGLVKTHTEGELRAFIARMNAETKRRGLAYIVEPKYDGVAISVTYEKGRLVRVVTRGNGTEGDDVTVNLRALADLPAQLKSTGPRFPDLIELRGEVYMTYDEFKRLNQERETAGEEAFAHPRNLAAGSLKRGAGDGPRRTLQVVFYGTGAVAPAAMAPRSQRELHAWIKSHGLPAIGEFRTASNADEVWVAVQSLGRKRATLPYPIDGAVVKLDDLKLGGGLGATAEGPRSAIAYKFPPTTHATRVTGITLQIGRTGLLSPVAELEPIRIGGTVIRRATLHNRGEIARKDIRVGDWVFLEKAGEIIPAITGVDVARRPAGLKPFAFPASCPVCATVLETEEAATRCPNRACAAQVQRRLEHFASNGAVGIAGLGKVLLAALVRAGAIKEPADLYTLTVRQLREVTTEKTANKVLAAIAESRKRERWRFVYGVGVPEVGPVGAKAIAEAFSGLGAWARAQDRDYRATGINQGTQGASLAFFADERNRDAVEALARELGEKAGPQR